jgi:hypothetical protein
MTCTEMGDTYVITYHAASGATSRLLLENVLISTSFPFHIFSKILVFERLCTATNGATKALGSWQFFSPAPDRIPLLHASQHLVSVEGHQQDLNLYFIDQPPLDVQVPRTLEVINTE